MKKNGTGPRYTLIALRNLLIVIASLFAVMLTINFLLWLQLAFTPEADNDRAVVMGYEKTPISKLLSTEENIVYAKQFFENPADFDRFMKDETPSVVKYPLIDDMKTTADYDENTVNIVVFGDSFVWGEGSLNRNELFWRQLEQMLREEGYNVRVYAVAQEGATGYEELRWLQSGVLDELRPELVIFGYVFNDAMRPGNGFGKMPERLVIPQLTWMEKLFPQFAQKIYAYVDAKTLYSKKYGDRYKDSYISVLDDDLAPYYAENFIEPLAAFSKENSLPAVVVTLPNSTNSLLLEELYKPLEGLFEGTGIGYYNSYPTFKKEYGGGKHKKNILVNPKNVHPGSAAHRFYAEYIRDLLKRDYADVLGQSAGTDLNSKKIIVNERMPGDIDLKTVSESADRSEYTFSYPDITAPHSLYAIPIEPYCLEWPVDTDYIKLSFETPVRLSEVTITGDNGQKIELYYTTVNEKLRYDDHSVSRWEASGGDASVWRSDRDDRLTSLCIHSDKPGKLTVTIAGKAVN